jgi:hypothetical protein
MYAESNGTVNGCWHDPNRESLSGDEYDEHCLDFGGGGHTLFLYGEVIWMDVGELLGAGPSYEANNDYFYYFAMEKPDD